MSILTRWEGRLAQRRVLEHRAEVEVTKWEHHAGSPAGVAALRRARAKLALRHQQVLEAERVVNRHAGISTVSNNGLALIAGFEGFRSKPYQDIVGVWTIGYGETKGIGPSTPPWSRDFALRRLRVRVNQDYLAPVLARCKAVGFNPTQHQADALASLVYNCGPGILAPGHTLGDALASKDVVRIANAFLVYDVAGDNHVPGLASRRRVERALFLKR